MSTGDAVYVVTDGEVVEVPPEQASQLATRRRRRGVADLGIAGWIRDPQVEGTDRDRRGRRRRLPDRPRPHRRAQLGGGAEPASSTATPPSASTAWPVRAPPRSCSATTTCRASIHLVVDFGGEVPDELREALGPYASANLELTVALERLTDPLVVDAPTG